MSRRENPHRYDIQTRADVAWGRAEQVSGHHSGLDIFQAKLVSNADGRAGLHLSIEVEPVYLKDVGHDTELTPGN